MDAIFGWQENFIISCSICNNSHLVIYILFENVCLYGMFKTNLDFANLCLYNELDEISYCFIFCDEWQLFFCVSTRHQKIKNTIVRNSFSAVVYTACNIRHTIEKLIAVLSVSSENILPLLLHERAPLTMYYWDYTPFCSKRHFLQHSRPLQSQMTALLLHTMFRLKREEFDQFNTSLNYVNKYPVSMRYC